MGHGAHCRNAARRCVLIMAEVTLVNYGLGNIRAFANIYNLLNIDVAVASKPDELAAAKRLVLPGVGAFDWAMARLNGSGLREMLDKQVLENRVPVLGVCVGMQMMADRSEEGQQSGLGWIPGSVRKFRGSDRRIPTPHMGWNDVAPQFEGGIFQDILNPRYYFLHSFCMSPDADSDVLAMSDYGGAFVSAIGRGNVLGTQFHPEKSHQWGVRLLKNFSEIATC
jgi:glutamine amidotransferase